MSVSRAAHYRNRRSPLLEFAKQIVSLELIWPFPLVAVGVLGIVDPLIAGAAVVVALMPWLARLLVFGRLTRYVFAGGAMVLFIVSAFVSMGATYDPALSWPMLLTVLGSVCLFFAVANTGVSARWLVGWLVVAASLMALYFVGQYAHFDYPREAGRLARLGRMTGSLLPDLVLFTPHPNAVAGFLEGALLLSLVLARKARAGERLGWGLTAAIIAYGLLISGSRGAWIGLAVAMGIWMMLLFPKRAPHLAGGGLGMIAGGLLGGYAVAHLMPSNQHILFLRSVLDTANSRFTLYRNSLYLLGDYPFTGIGLGDTFAMVYSRYQLFISVPFLYYAHNLFLSVGLGQGILGLAALAWLLIGFYHFAIRVERAGLSAGSLSLFRAAWLGTTAIFGHSLTDSPQFSGARWTMPMLFALLGLAVAIGRPALRQANQGEVSDAPVGWRRRWGWVVLAAMAIVALTVSVLVFWRPLTSAWYANMGAIYQTRADLSPNLDDPVREATMMRAVTYFERALNLNPSQPVANRRLGIVALDQGHIDTAATYLEQAYRREPGNQATLKTLGYAYLWTGQLDPARELFQQVEFRSRLVAELNYWSWWWGKQERQDLSAYADEMVQRLLQE